ncbi:unnamed protein product [Heligmosomoides polygyrus]|uniref:Oxidoreductase-like domain-containing protein n=1 Tax=Heligmosomoides polygyrus TaxID=6339 RepID=A0A183G995_HELPZ|nr:unnamed protein product [Heligmosomoides polygyrus]
MFTEPLEDKVVRLVRKHISENKEQVATWDDEPPEPLPQDCCGQSCRPCVFDIHREDVVRWAKDCAKRIPFEGGVSLYTHLYQDEISEDRQSEDNAFSKEEYRKFLLTDITSLSPDTKLYTFEIANGSANLPIGSHLRTRYVSIGSEYTNTMRKRKRISAKS